MGFVELLILSIGLSMDAFAIAIVCGLGMKNFKLSGAIIVGLYFGIAQGLMPLIGYFVGSRFADKISSFDHWVIFALLALIGAKMIYESFRKDGEKNRKETSLRFTALFPLAIADSIDALGVGISFAFMDVNVVFAASFICLITLIISIAGVKIGNIFGLRYKAKAELAGGIILVLLGVKALVEGLL